MSRSLLIAILSTILFGCQTDIELAELIDKNSPIILTVMPKDSHLNDLRTDTILSKSDKWNKLLQFSKTNSSNWNSTPASYIADFYIRQDNFQLMGWNDGTSVVINYIDSNGQANQLTRTIKPGELNFLTE
ncbi:MAG: hypothetical protein RIA69_04175 [Cyclobacteriaceae bacterium]